MSGGNLPPPAPRNDMPSSVFRSLAPGMPTTPSAGKDDHSSRPCHQDCLQRSPTYGPGEAPGLAGVWHGFQIRDGLMLWTTGLRHDLLLQRSWTRSLITAPHVEVDAARPRATVVHR